MISDCKCGHTAADHGVSLGYIHAVGAVDVTPVWCNPAEHLCQCRHFTAYSVPVVGVG